MFTASAADAHIALRSPAPRSADQKAGPCGAAGSTRGATVATYTPGETITVEWDETVDHPGHFRIAFDDDGQDVFVNPMLHTDSYPWVLAEPIADKAGGHYTQQVTLPDAECANCTLQLMQIMTTTEPYDSFYYQCADIAISANGGGSGSGGDGGGGESSGGCAAGGGGGGGVIGLGLAVGLIALRRRRVTAG